MSLRDLFVFAAVFGTLPFVLRKPYIGIYLWSWLGYMNPHRLAWGLAYDFPFCLYCRHRHLGGHGVFTRAQASSVDAREYCFTVIDWLDAGHHDFLAVPSVGVVADGEGGKNSVDGFPYHDVDQYARED